MTNQPRVLLCTLSVRTSAKGNSYLSGFLGRAKVVAFQGKADRYDNATWDVCLTPGEERPRHEPEVSGLVDTVPEAF